MTIKLNSLARWRPYMGDVLMLEGHETGERRVRLHFNVETETAIYRVFEDTDDQQLIAVVPPGLETVEFAAAGNIRFMCVSRDAEAQVWYQTADDEPTFSVVADPVIFTKIANRRHRNPELEEVMHRMHVNMERRLAQQASEFDAALQRRREEELNGRSAEVVTTNAPGAAANAGVAAVQPPEPPANEPEAVTGGEDDGEQPSGGS